MTNPDPSELPDSLANLVAALVESAHADSRQLLTKHASEPSVQAAVKAVQGRNIQEFYYLFSNPMSALADAVLEAVMPGQARAQFLFRHAGFVESHLEKIIARFEGSPCSVDKVRTIMAALLNHQLTGNEIEFNYSQEYTYHLPRVVLCTHEKIVAFYDGLYRLYYGQPQAYLAALADIHTLSPQ